MALIDYRVLGQFNHFQVFLPSPAFTSFPGVASLATQVRGKHPGGVNAILIGLMPAPSFKIAPQQSGIIAILIGLLLPAVQKLADPGSADLHALIGLLRPGGSIGVAMGDGSVRVLAGPPMNFSLIR